MKMCFTVLIFATLASCKASSQDIIINKSDNGMASYKLASDTAYMNHRPELSPYLQTYGVPVDFEQSHSTRKALSDLFTKHIGKLDEKKKYVVDLYLKGNGKIEALTVMTSDDISLKKISSIIRDVKKSIKLPISDKYKNDAYVGRVAYVLLTDSK